METKITMPRLAAMLAITTGKQKKLCEDFIKEIFRIVSDELAAGESVRIKGFGTFKLVEVEARKSVNVATGEEYEIAGHQKIMFVAAKELASAVNAPFDAFEAVEISDDLPTDIFMAEEVAGCATEESDSGEAESDAQVACVAAGGADDAMPAEDAVPETQDQGHGNGGINESDAEASEPTLIKELEEEAAADMASEEAYAGADSAPVERAPYFSIVIPENNDSIRDADRGQDNEETCAEAGDGSDEERHPRRFVGGFVAGFLAAALIGGGLLWWMHTREADTVRAVENAGIEAQAVVPSGGGDSQVSPDSSGERTVAPAPESADSAVASTSSSTSSSGSSADDDVPTVPSDRPVYDTVTTTRYLTIIAKEHYGNFNLWPIIYEENKAILGHPNRIKPGTRIVVPPLSKYGVDPSNKADVDRVKRQGTEIYKRFK